MSAFKWNHASQINENIKTLFRRLKSVSNLTLTHEDFLSLFVPTHHRDMYRAMATFSETGDARRARFRWGSADLDLRLNELPGKFPPPIPRGMVLQGDAPRELIERIETWITNGGNASVDFGRVMKLFETLNGELTKAQIRFVWPSIIPLCNLTEVLSPLALELQDLKAAGGVSLPRGLLMACRKTAAAISLAGLIPADAVEQRVECEVSVGVLDGQKRVEDSLGEFYGLYS